MSFLEVAGAIVDCITPYPSCCGIYILHGFYDGPSEKGIDAVAKAIADRLGKSSALSHYTIQAVLSDENSKVWRKVLEKVGFTLISTFESGTTGNQLSLFQLEPRTPYSGDDEEEDDDWY